MVPSLQRENGSSNCSKESISFYKLVEHAYESYAVIVSSESNRIGGYSNELRETMGAASQCKQAEQKNSHASESWLVRDLIKKYHNIEVKK